MPYARTRGVRLYYESRGSGRAVVFAHEFAGDLRSWAPQVRSLSRRYRCVTFNARGYLPSDVPTERHEYSQDLAIDDIAAVMRSAGVRRAHLVGHSMGAYSALQFAMRHPAMVRSVVIIGCGYGSDPSQRLEFQQQIRAAARRFAAGDSGKAALAYARGKYRLTFREKDPRGWGEFVSQLSRQSPTGLALTLRGVQERRESVYAMAPRLRRLRRPVLVVTGDEDQPCVEPSIFLYRAIPKAALWVLPRTGHMVTLEEPDSFTAGLLRFCSAVDAGQWPPRRDGSTNATLLGMDPHR